MIDTTNNLMYRLELLNKQNSLVNYQMSTGKEIQNGSENSLLYNEILNIENEISTYEAIEIEINKTQLFNNSSDKALSEIKTQMDAINSEVLKALNAGVDQSSKTAISKNVENMKENIYNLVNQEANGEYLFSGESTSSKPFESDINGNVTYEGSNDYKNTIVEKNIYKEQGVTGIDVAYYTNESAKTSEILSFSPGELVVDDEGNKWKFIDNNGDGNIDTNMLYKNGDISSTSMAVIDLGTTPTVYNVVNTQSSTLETKHSYFEDLDEIINALDSKDKNGNPISEENASAILSTSLEKMDKAYDSVNTAHAELGSKNATFENASLSISAKVTNYQIYYEETASADLTEAAIKAQSLELTYSALYSTISKVNSLSLVNFL